MSQDKIDMINQSIKSIADYPKPGIIFRDITGLIENGPAEDSGLLPNDRIISVDDQEVSVMNDLASYLSEKSIGDVIILRVVREDKILEYSITLSDSAILNQPIEN